MDVFLVILGVAVLAIGFVNIVGIMRVVVVDETSAAAAGGIIVFVAVVAEGHRTVSFRFRTPDAVKTAVTDGGEFLEAVVAHKVVVKFVHGVLGKFCSAVEAGELFRHDFVLLNVVYFGLVPQG